MLASRDRQPEAMDRPDLAEPLHRQALDGLARVNRVSGTAGQLWRSIVLETGRPARLRLLDVACGGGDIATRLWQLAARSGVDIEITGLDVSPNAVSRARERVAASAPVHFERSDVLNDPLPAGYDVVMSSLFLHHLDGATAARLLGRMGGSSRGLVLAHDLRRNVAGLALALVGTRVLSRSPIVHVDGPRSVRAAFTVREMAELARSAGLERVRVRRRWPQRLILTARSAR